MIWVAPLKIFHHSASTLMDAAAAALGRELLAERVDVEEGIQQMELFDQRPYGPLSVYDTPVTVSLFLTSG